MIYLTVEGEDYGKSSRRIGKLCKVVCDRQLTESTGGGNMSIRIDNKVYITPTFLLNFFAVKDIKVTSGIK
jgi:ribulose-5-phosphate 4-epimerase/fuculose-1-phosphate aldolase